MHIHQEVKMPRLHGDGPRNLGAVIRTPRAPSGPIKFNSFKDAMTYLKKKQIQEMQDEYEG